MKIITRAFIGFLMEFDTITIRLLMSAASLVFSGSMLASQRPFTQEAYGIMEWVGHQIFWAGVFSAYGFSTIWLICKTKVHRPLVNLFWNMYGFFVWGFYTLSISLSIGYFAPGTSLEWVAVALMAWSTFKTAGRRVR